MRREEISRLEAVVRDANPVPSVESLFDSEEASAVTLLVDQRRRTMTTVPTQTEPEPRSLHRRRSTMWAFAGGFIVILLAIGTAALFLRGDDIRTAGEPTPSPTVTTPGVTATTWLNDLEPATSLAGWQRIEEPWLASDGVSVEALPDGGFVAVGAGPSEVMWSPDGLNWFEGDPQRLLPHQEGEVAVVGDHVILLAGGDATPTFWIGDPKTGKWGPLLELNTSGLERHLVPGSIGMAAGKDAVLVTGITTTEPPSDGGLAKIGSVVVWLVDPELGTATRTNLPVGPPVTQDGWGSKWGGDWFAWFDGRWHTLVAWVGDEDWRWTEHVLWSSPNGTTWNQEELPEGWQMPVLNGFTVGSSGVVTCAAINGDEETAGTWFSPNGVDWHSVGAHFCRGVYSDTLGFVSDGELSFVSDGGPGFYQLSPDGTTLEEWVSPFPFDAVAASGNNLIVNAYVGSEYGASESAGIKGLWLYHHPIDE